MRKVFYLLAVMTLCIFCLILMNYETPFFVKFDKEMSDLFYGNEFIIAFHYIGETKIIIVIALILLMLLWLKKRNYRAMVFVLLTVGAGNVLNQLVKRWIGRPRPEMVDQLTSFSFPSGHAMISLLYLFTIAFLLSELLKSNKKIIVIWIIASILTFLTGLSRVAENRHFASDVIAGWCLGYSWFMLCVFWYGRGKMQLEKLKK